MMKSQTTHAKVMSGTRMQKRTRWAMNHRGPAGAGETGRKGAMPEPGIH
jgi:hypothetical protein